MGAGARSARTGCPPPRTRSPDRCRGEARPSSGRISARCSDSGPEPAQAVRDRTLVAAQRCHDGRIGPDRPLVGGTAQHQPAVPARADSTSAVLPTPPSPATRKSPPSPPAAVAIASRRAARSRCLPTSSIALGMDCSVRRPCSHQPQDTTAGVSSSGTSAPGRLEQLGPQGAATVRPQRMERLTVGPWKLALKSRTAPAALMAAAEDERLEPIALDAPLPLAAARVVLIRRQRRRVVAPLVGVRGCPPRW